LYYSIGRRGGGHFSKALKTEQNYSGISSAVQAKAYVQQEPFLREGRKKSIMNGKMAGRFGKKDAFG